MSLQLKVAEKLVEPLEVRVFLSRGLVVASRGKHYYAVFMSLPPEESSSYQSHIYFRLSSLLLSRVPVVLTKWQYYTICW